MPLAARNFAFTAPQFYKKIGHALSLLPQHQQQVIDSRPSREANAIRRRRECLHCNRRFTT